jgi:hypothetical protein
MVHCLAFGVGCSASIGDKTTCGEGTHLDGSECIPDASSDMDGGAGLDTAEVLDTSDDPIDADEDGYTPAEGDCDDANADIHPDATEICDGVDNDCDAAIDDDDDDLDLSTSTSWYADADGDGYGDLDATLTQCSPPEGYIEEGPGGFDCNDNDPAFHPGAEETDCADPNDYNCDGSASYADTDRDGWAACEECNDADPGINPDADEVCDAVDNDCDGLTDDEDDSLDTATASPWYADADDDGFGDEAESIIQCEAPTGYVAEAPIGFDCDDDDPAFYPGAEETDCADPSDYNCDGSVAYADDDDDGWAACEECDDRDSSINPDADEVCDAVDNDCDGLTDDEDDSLDTATASPWYADADDDGFGDEAESIVQCAAPIGYVAEAPSGFDCDDDDPAFHPGAEETDCADPNDYNCDGSVDYADDDGDGWAACEECDDTDADVRPDAVETCNGLDDDCDGDIDDADSSVVGTETWFIDYDGDGFGSSRFEMKACDATPGWVASDSDCDDTNPAINPDAIEICNAIDDDCDGATDDDDDSVTGVEVWYLDSDLDGFGDADVSTTACYLMTGYVADDTDCDDTDADRNPDAIEVDGDGVDNDCVNDPPEISSLEINPIGARTDDTLILSIIDSDPDGDPITHDITWTVDGITVDTGSTELDGSLFSRDQVVAAVVTPTDGTDSGSTVEASLTIANTAPGPAVIHITPSAPVPGEDALSCIIDLESLDADDDLISYTFEWTVDGAPFTDAVTGTRPGDTVPVASLGGVETWVCRVTPTDGTEPGIPVESAIVTEPDPIPTYAHDNGQGVIWYNEVPTGTINSSQAQLSCQATYGSCELRTGDCAGYGWCQPGGTKCWGWTSGCSGGAGRVWLYGSSYTTYGTWN